MFNQLTERSKPFFKIIGNALKSRGQEPEDYERHATHGQPNYVVRMCEQLHKQINREDVSIEKVLRVEQYASGHVDYHTKCALYCAELADGSFRM